MPDLPAWIQEIRDRVDKATPGPWTAEDANPHKPHKRFAFYIPAIMSAPSMPQYDGLAEEWARENGIPIKRFPADWDKHGKAAGPIRNRAMAEYADALLAVWDGESKGTANMILEMHRMGKPVFVWRVNGCGS